jgi:tetratricopeptide (TPR) repeat protein
MKTLRTSALNGRLSGVFLRSALHMLRYAEVMVGRGPQFRLIVLGSLLFFAGLAVAQDDQSQKLNREFQSAVTQYNAGRYTDAAARLESLLPQVPQSFEVQELLGLVYASESNNSRAVEHLQEAVRLKPDSAAARTNLATSLSHAGKLDLAGEQFRKAIELEPRDFDANHDLGEFYIQTGKIADATPYLEAAQRINPAAYDNGYDLAMAYLLTERLDRSHEVVESLLKQKNTAELHNLLAQVDEKQGKFLDAVNEFENAAQMDPNEDNLFDWGSELLLHRTYEPAIDVFQHAARRYPHSQRLMIGLGLALYSRGKYDEAVKALLTAADLDPTDPRCYLFLSKAYDSSPNQADEVIQRFRRFSELQPHNGLAVYYYALSLWKGKRAEDASLDMQQVEALLQKSVSLDPKLADPHVQLGNLYADQHEYAKSIPEYMRALELNPNLPDAHYRLGQDYVHSGHKDLAQTEFEVYQRLRAQRMAELDKERAEVQQFVYSEKAAPSAKQ